MYAVFAHTQVGFAFVVAKISRIHVPIVQAMPACLLYGSLGGYATENHRPLGVGLYGFKIGPDRIDSLGQCLYFFLVLKGSPLLLRKDSASEV